MAAILALAALAIFPGFIRKTIYLRRKTIGKNSLRGRRGLSYPTISSLWQIYTTVPGLSRGLSFFSQKLYHSGGSVVLGVKLRGNPMPQAGGWFR
jgi:hypothetical protein